ncbi:MAG: sugar phosphate isomerase/epimerase [Oscillospiraceae bacterium]|jgi:sugar phosphate isomerase/epimerase|nr:sugar phosphate isomerase/epimerase [Oscillospiraceae bacterium]
MQIGAQLYTTRDLMRSPEGIRSTLERVAAIGYKYIQCSGFAFEAAEMKALCDSLGLGVRLTHTACERILNDTENVIREHLLLQCPYVGVGYMPGQHTPAGARQFLQEFTPAMQALHAAGLKLQYHNHAFEYARLPEGDVWSVLVNESDPALLGFTLDVFWAQYGGKNVPELIRALKGRIDVCHVKDMNLEEHEHRFAAVGEGVLEWPGILGALEETGTEYAFVEQDDCYGKDPLEELETSFRFLAQYYA